MKKIFISALALFAVACAGTDGMFKRDSSNYWLNHIRNYTTYPVYYYAADEFDSSEKLAESKDIVTHTYQRNVVVSARVGQRMVDSETFKIKRFTQNKIMAQSDGVISNTGSDIHITKGQEFYPLGEVKIDGKYYMLIDADGKGGILLLDEYGHVLPSINALYHGDLMFSRNYSSVYPENLLIKQTDTERMDVSDPKENFEIRYDGLNNGLFELTYIDYTGEQAGRAQKFVYNQNAQYIDVNGVKMEITGVYPDRIEYKLLD